jgi:histidinol phosphatase-like enzyme (inositol monophosphatase family)
MSFIETAFLHRLADAADEETLPRFRRRLAVETKVKLGETFDPVTEADRAAERVMRAILERSYPEHGIWGEEYGQIAGDGRHCWVLDPVDGTRPFLCGLPVWATLIGLTIDGRATAGMMSQPFTGERFWADGTTAWHRRDEVTTPLQTRTDRELSTATLHTTSPVVGRGKLDGAFARLARSVQLTRYGGEAYAVAMLAAGLIDICFEPALAPYDIVALIPIIEQAGGTVSGLEGERAEVGGAVLMSGSPRLHFDALELLNK